MRNLYSESFLVYLIVKFTKTKGVVWVYWRHVIIFPKAQVVKALRARKFQGYYQRIKWRNLDGFYVFTSYGVITLCKISADDGNKSGIALEFA